MLQPALSRPRYRGPRQGSRQSYGSPGKARSEVVKVAQRWPTWVRRLVFAAVLILAAATPGMAATWPSSPCQHSGCEKAGTVRWIRPLPGSWTVQNGTTGTTPATGQAYGALGAQLAVIGSGLTVSAYRASTGQQLWATRLTGFAPGSAITAVRVWPGVVTVGVMPPAPDAAPATDGGPVPVGGPPRREVVLRASTGHRVRAYPAAQFGGAVAASPSTTVVVGPHAVTSYANRTGAVRWSRPTGPVPQDWQVDGRQFYLAVAAGGYLGSAPVTALHRINLATGAQRVVRPHGSSYDGTLSLAYQRVVVFSSARGAKAYSGSTGQELWQYPHALPDTVDAVAGRLYLISGNTLIGVVPQAGTVLARVNAASSSGLYGVREGAVLGIDHGGLGKAWAYDIATQRVLWTSRPLPWPHYFVDLSGIGGSAPPGEDAVLLAVCGKVGPQPAGTAPPPCARPELAVVNR
jgi:PQQ-like domain